MNLASSSADEARLARDIIQEDFGPVVTKIADLMIQRYPGHTSLAQLITHFQDPTTSARTVQSALLVMQRHNLLKVQPIYYSLRLYLFKTPETK
jgi:hypothetical protein